MDERTDDETPMCVLLHKSERQSYGRRAGVTLLEVLVTLAILGLLLGLLLPAVQRVRATAARGSCQSRMRELAIAVHQYGDVHVSLPAGCDYPFATDDEAPLKQVGLSWHTSILPFIEQNALWRLGWEAHRTDPIGNHVIHDQVRAIVVPVFLCPADSRSTGRTHRGVVWALADYLGLAGTGVRTN
jgi:prepilin-type N-terminal cleavage/methylation domain-containing protein